MTPTVSVALNPEVVVAVDRPSERTARKAAGWLMLLVSPVTADELLASPLVCGRTIQLAYQRVAPSSFVTLLRAVEVLEQWHGRAFPSG